MLPTTANQRLKEIDIIRGFALFGVLLVNLTMIDRTLFGSLTSFRALQGADAAASFIIYFLAQGKFYTIFSFLFGLGFFLFMDKPDPEKRTLLFKRRLYALLLFGVMHLILVWYGDILHNYAICGFILLAVGRNKSFNYKRAIVILLVASTVIMALTAGLSSVDTGDYDIETYSEAEAIAENAYTQDSYMDMVLYRATGELPIVVLNLLFVTIKLIAIFFIGYLVGAKRVFHDIAAYYPSIKRFCAFSGVAFALTIAGELALYTLSKEAYWIRVIVGLLNEAGTLVGALFYVTGLLCLLQTAFFKKLLSPLQYMGRMALTNYLTQTIVFTTFFFGYGFGYFGKLPMRLYPLLAISFYCLQLLISALWLKRFKFGPMEALWRKMTYGNQHAAR